MKERTRINTLPLRYLTHRSRTPPRTRSDKWVFHTAPSDRIEDAQAIEATTLQLSTRRKGQPSQPPQTAKCSPPAPPPPSAAAPFPPRAPSSAHHTITLRAREATSLSTLSHAFLPSAFGDSWPRDSVFHSALLSGRQRRTSRGRLRGEMGRIGGRCGV